VAFIQGVGSGGEIGVFDIETGCSEARGGAEVCGEKRGRTANQAIGVPGAGVHGALTLGEGAGG
jgi:hypothetical protein